MRQEITNAGSWSGQYFITTELLTVDTADCIINVITTQLVTVDSVLLFPKDHNHGLVTSFSGNRIVLHSLWLHTTWQHN